MKFLGNILWVALGGIELAFAWAVLGILLTITIIGAPFGVQCFKMAKLSLWPFGSEIENDTSGSALGFLGNLLWFFLVGFWQSVSHLIVGIVFCCTIIGIPFGTQHFKIAKFALNPFGKNVVLATGDIQNAVNAGKQSME